MKYWEEKGKYQKELDTLWKTLVPERDEAPTEDGEILRTMNNFVYDLYNNGLCNLDSKKDMFDKFLTLTHTIKFSKKGKECRDTLEELLENYIDGLDLSDDTIDTETCYSCSGYGEIDGEVCEECNGTGEVEEFVMSEQEENWEGKVKPLIDKLFNLDDGVTALMDDVMAHLLEKKYIKDILERSPKEQHV